jgi:hypothetical protein
MCAMLRDPVLGVDAIFQSWADPRQGLWCGLRRSRHKVARNNPAFRAATRFDYGSMSEIETSSRPTPRIVAPPTISMSRSLCRQGSRRDLEHKALVLASAGVGCAKDISIFIHGYAAVGLRTLAAADEVVKVGKGPAALSRR